MIRTVEEYLANGCGRCNYYKTTKCKAIRWNSSLKILRSMTLKFPEIREEVKWSQPCYTFNGNNLFLITAFKEFPAISFFKGSLLPDKKGQLVQPGKNSAAVRQLRFSGEEDILSKKNNILRFIKEAITVEKSGQKVAPDKKPADLPAELSQRFAQDPGFRKAFEALTPGRQRGYILYFTQAKQSATRIARINKYYEQIMLGEGLHDGYKK